MHTILTVTTDDRLKSALEYLLSAKGSRIRFSKNQEIASASCAVVSPQVVIIDLATHDVDGFKCIQKLRATVPTSVPIVALSPPLSSEHETMIKDYTLRSGATFFLIDPIDPKILRDFVCGLLCFCDQFAFAEPELANG